MTDYIPFTEAQREQARQTDLVAFLRQCGQIVKPSSKSHGKAATPIMHNNR